MLIVRSQRVYIHIATMCMGFTVMDVTRMQIARR